MSLQKCLSFFFLNAFFLFCFLAGLSQTNPSSKEHKWIVIQMNRLFNEGKVDSAMMYYSDSLTKAGNINGQSAFLAMQEDIATTFPDIQTKILDIWEDADWVITRCQFTGTHKGTAKLPHHGGLFVGLPPTGKKFSVQHIRMYKLIAGKIVARQAIRDDLAMYQQLGILPAPAPFKPNRVTDNKATDR